MSRRVIVAALLALALLTACSGVPTTSKVDVLRSGVSTQVTTGTHTDPAPKKGIGPRDLVLGFLQASLTSVSAARQFLTPDAQRRWQGQTTSVLRNRSVRQPTVVPANGTATVQVVGNLLATVDVHGVYTPGPLTKRTYTIGVQQVAGQWRISTPPPTAAGALVSESDFESYYTSHSIFFLNPAGDRVVPDIRYSIQRGQALAEWLLQQLVAGSRPDLASAVITEIPDQTDASRLVVTVPDQRTVRVDFPGASQLDRTTLLRLAAQLAYTLDEGGSLVAPFLSGITLSDGRRTVDIPGIGSSFGRSDLASFNPEGASPAGVLFYVQGGSLVSEIGKKHVAGEWGTGTLALTSAAVTTVSGVQQIAAVGGQGKVYVGPAGGTATAVKVPPATGRPQWQPGSSIPTAWLPTTGGLYRITISPSGPVASAVPLTSPFNGAIQGAVSSFVFAPGGTRVAAVINGVAYVGSLVANGASVAAQNFIAITPAPVASTADASTTTVSVADLAFESSTQMWVIAAFDHGPQRIYRTMVDGQGLNPADPVPDGGLSDSPDKLASPGGMLVVSTIDGVIWSDPDNTGWDSIVGSAADRATEPTYST